MKKLAFLFLIATSPLLAQKGEMFPELTGTTLQDKTIRLPTDTKGKFTILCLTYSQKSSDVLKPWFQPLYDTFLSDPEYDINLYFIPLLSGIKELAAGAIEKKMKQGIDPLMHPYILLYKGEIGSYKQTLKMPDKELPYFFMLDKTGKIVYHTSGNYSEDKINKMEEVIE
jgi:ATP10 protein